MTKRLLALSLVVLGCGGEKSGKEAENLGPAPIAPTIHKVERLDVVTYPDSKLSKKPAAGNEFLCVQFEAKNIGAAPSNWGGPLLVDADGKETKETIETAGIYKPAGWETSTATAKIEPGATGKYTACFEVVKGASPTQFALREGSWGEKKGWRAVIALPAVTASN